MNTSSQCLVRILNDYAKPLGLKVQCLWTEDDPPYGKCRWMVVNCNWSYNPKQDENEELTTMLDDVTLDEICAFLVGYKAKEPTMADKCKGKAKDKGKGKGKGKGGR